MLIPGKGDNFAEIVFPWIQEALKDIRRNQEEFIEIYISTDTIAISKIRHIISTWQIKKGSGDK